MSRINEWLDRLPRATVHLTGAESPAFRAVGVCGFHLALVTMIGGALLRGLPMTVAVVIALTAAASFFVWGMVRRLLARREALVLFEHVWIAGAAVAGVLMLLSTPLLIWFDVLAVALAVFLAAGRLGCGIAGCCHGHPAGIGIRYPEDHPVSRIAGLRLFPVPLVECAGLLIIALTGLVALPFAAAGTVLVWAMAAYAVLRFGMESLRGDRRPHVIGIPVARLSAAVQLVAALVIDSVRRPGALTSTAATAAAIGLVASGLIGLGWYHRRARPVTADSAAQVRSLLVAGATTDDQDGAGDQPVVTSLPGGITVATSATPDGVHLSVGGAGTGLALRRRLVDAAMAGEGPVVVGADDVVHVFARVPPTQLRTAEFRLPPWIHADQPSATNRSEA